MLLTKLSSEADFVAATFAVIYSLVVLLTHSHISILNFNLILCKQNLVSQACGHNKVVLSSSNT